MQSTPLGAPTLTSKSWIRLTLLCFSKYYWTGFFSPTNSEDMADIIPDSSFSQLTHSLSFGSPLFEIHKLAVCLRIKVLRSSPFLYSDSALLGPGWVSYSGFEWWKGLVVNGVRVWPFGTCWFGSLLSKLNLSLRFSRGRECVFFLFL